MTIAQFAMQIFCLPTGRTFCIGNPTMFTRNQHFLGVILFLENVISTDYRVDVLRPQALLLKLGILKVWYVIKFAVKKKK